MNKREKITKCVFCNDKIYGYGNNPLPIIEGRCCDRCNKRLVVPHRILLSRSLEIHKKDVLEAYKIKDD